VVHSTIIEVDSDSEDEAKYAPVVSGSGLAALEDTPMTDVEEEAPNKWVAKISIAGDVMTLSKAQEEDAMVYIDVDVAKAELKRLLEDEEDLTVEVTVGRKRQQLTKDEIAVLVGSEVASFEEALSPLLHK
jgi:hypothetical protein